jgi:L-threonylcarbamoyladenylate synthase
MTVPETRVLPFDDAAIAQATALIRAGQPVAVATETVYGLAADATNGEAVARIYAAKGRPSFNPRTLSRRKRSGCSTSRPSTLQRSIGRGR